MKTAREGFSGPTVGQLENLALRCSERFSERYPNGHQYAEISWEAAKQLAEQILTGTAERDNFLLLVAPFKLECGVRDLFTSQTTCDAILISNSSVSRGPFYGGSGPNFSTFTFRGEDVEGNSFQLLDGRNLTLEPSGTILYPPPAGATSCYSFSFKFSDSSFSLRAFFERPLIPRLFVVKPQDDLSMPKPA